MSRKIRILIIFFIFLSLYSSIRGENIFRQSPFPHYVYLADAFLNKSPSLTSTPPNHFNMKHYDSKWFIYNLPLPAILIAPFVAIFGFNFNDTIFFTVIGAVNCVLIYLILEKLYIANAGNAKTKQKFVTWLTFLFGIGTVHWYIACNGSVWFAAHITALLFLNLAILASLKKEKNWALVGSLIGLAMLSRPTVALAIVFFFLILYKDYCSSKALFIKQCIIFVFPIAILTLLLLSYNYARFESFFCFGGSYGNLKPRFIPMNLYASLLMPPNLTDKFPFVEPNPMGMSIFLTTPAFIYIFRGFKKNILFIGSWTGIILISIPLMMHFSTGYYQFGYRHSMDYMPFLIILTALGMNWKLNNLRKLLIMLSIIINFLGTLWFYTSL